jgi:hypothetical protein
MESTRSGGVGRGRRRERQAGIFVGEAESASWLGGAPCARVVDPETDQEEVVPIFPAWDVGKRDSGAASVPVLQVYMCDLQAGSTT